MQWLPIDSSVFTAVGYVPDRQFLYLQFRSGEVYRYFDFPPDRYHAFLSAESKGRYFASNIRDRFRCDRLARLSRAANKGST